MNLYEVLHDYKRIAELMNERDEINHRITLAFDKLYKDMEIEINGEGKKQ